MFERFSTESRDVVARAFDLARGMGHSHVGVGHLLAALSRGCDSTAAVLAEHGLSVSALDPLIELDDGPATAGLTQEDAEALRSLGIDLDHIRSSVEKYFGQGALDTTTSTAEPARWWRRGARQYQNQPDSMSVHLPLTSGAKRSLELSPAQATRLGDNHVATAHVALGVIGSDDGLVTKVLTKLGTDTDTIRSGLETARRRRA